MNVDNSEQVACLPTKHPKRRKKRRHRHELHQFPPMGSSGLWEFVSGADGIGDTEGKAATGSGERAGRQASFKFVSQILWRPADNPPSSSGSAVAQRLRRGRRELMRRMFAMNSDDARFATLWRTTAGLRHQRTHGVRTCRTPCLERLLS